MSDAARMAIHDAVSAYGDAVAELNEAFHDREGVDRDLVVTLEDVAGRARESIDRAVHAAIVIAEARERAIRLGTTAGADGLLDAFERAVRACCDLAEADGDEAIGAAIRERNDTRRALLRALLGSSPCNCGGPSSAGWCGACGPAEPAP